MVNKNYIVGTAGHIDHGKSALIKTLTGQDPDRFQEEKERGITIDLGFASMHLNDISISFVDVPGHEKLVKNMIAGATGFDMCMFAIDAAEGIMPQTIEHANIIDILGIKTLIIAITKTDKVPPDDLDIIISKIKSFFAAYNFKHIHYVPVSIYNNNSLTNLKASLVKACSESEPKNSDGPFMLRIDRKFTMKGFGTVITGTGIMGKIKVGEMLRLIPQEKDVKIRAIQVHSKIVNEACAGQRIALNLSGVSVGEITRGDILTRKNILDYTDKIFASLTMFNNLDKNIVLKNNKTYPIYIGATHIRGKIILSKNKIINAGEKIFCAIKLEKKYTPYFNETFLIRGGSPQITIAGGNILSITNFGFTNRDLFEALNALEKTGLQYFIKFLLDKKQVGINMPPLIQFSDKTFDELLEIFKRIDVYFKDGFIVYKQVVKNIIKALLGSLHKHGELSLTNLSRKYQDFPIKIIDEIENTIIGKSKKEGYVLQNKVLRKEETSAFELASKRILDTMQNNPSLTNPKVISETINTDEQFVIKLIKFLVNAEKIKTLDEKVYITTKSYQNLLKEIRLLCRKDGYVDITNIRKVVNLPRKILIPLLESLDNLDEFIKKENKRYLKPIANQ